ncbi:MAG: PAS domain S-box protein, partial [Thioalkalispiraceae bacterium]
MTANIFDQEEFYRTAFSAFMKSAVDAVILIDAQGVIQLFNPAAEKMFGYTANEVIGQNVKVLMPAPYREEHDNYLHNYHDTGEGKIIGIGREVMGQRKDQSIFPLDLAISEMEVGGKKYFNGVVRDITHLRQTES